MSNNKEIKMNYKKETKRCMMPKSYNEFKSMISKCYGITEKDIPNMLVSYTDDEEDKVLVTSDFDFEQAIIFMEKQKINILRINIDVPEKTDNFEVLRNNDISLVKSFKSNNIIIEESKESPKDLNNKTISSIGRDTERNVNKMSEICNKIENMTIVDTTEKANFSIKNDLQIIKENIKGLTVENNNFDNMINKLDDFKVELKPIVKAKKDVNAKKKKQRIKPVFSFTSKKNEHSEEITNFGAELRQNIDKMLEKKLAKIKNKIAKKAVKKTMKAMESFIAKKKSSPQDLESILPKEGQVHPGVSCDDCGVSPIKGHRYKCAVCHNFDFCSKCEEKNKDSHPHPFILIRHPERAPHSISCVVKESCPIIQKSIPFNQDYKLADAIINNSIIVDANELDAQCLTNYFDVYVKEDCKEIIKTLKFKNTGKKTWPKPVYLACITDSSTITGNSVPIKLKVDVGKQSNVEIKLNNKDLVAGEYVSIWQLQTEKKEFFGDKIILFVKVIKSDKKPEIASKTSVSNLSVNLTSVNGVGNLNKNNVNSTVNSNVNNVISQRSDEEIYNSFVYQCQVDEMKYAYDIKNFDDKTIKKAAIEAKGDVDLTLQILMNQDKK
jgi:hypothetical protein